LTNLLLKTESEAKLIIASRAHADKQEGNSLFRAAAAAGLIAPFPKKI
jgi:hypothetical protein